MDAENLPTEPTREVRDGLEIVSYDGACYKPMISFGAWRVAALNYGARFERLEKLERHLKTDEVFVLLDGEATLYVGEDARPVPMLRGLAYNVKAGTWHAIVTRKGARCLIVENDDTGRENSEYKEL